MIEMVEEEEEDEGEVNNDDDDDEQDYDHKFLLSATKPQKMDDDEDDVIVQENGVIPSLSSQIRLIQYPLQRRDPQPKSATNYHHRINAVTTTTIAGRGGAN
jgi:hypothetical protein